MVQLAVLTSSHQHLFRISVISCSNPQSTSQSCAAFIQFTQHRQLKLYICEKERALLLTRLDNNKKLNSLAGVGPIILRKKHTKAHHTNNQTW